MFEEYFAFQLEFARQYAHAAGVPFAFAIAHCTNLRRRLNLWSPEGEEVWSSLLRIAGNESQSFATLLRRCTDLYDQRGPSDGTSEFGCFSYDLPDAAGTVRIHFMPPAGHISSPLASENANARQDELRQMFTRIARTAPDARSVRGVSWLYHLEAYKRLFPDTYVASVKPAHFPVHLNGSSTWGQVLDWQQKVKPEVRNAVRRNFPGMDPAAPWKVFPLQALTANCNIGAFYDQFV